VLLLIVIGFIALIGSTIQMASGEGPATPVTYPRRSGRVIASLPLIGGLLALGVLGVWVPSALNEILLHAVRAIT
jgi:hypothetical protein